MHFKNHKVRKHMLESREKETARIARYARQTMPILEGISDNELCRVIYEFEQHDKRVAKLNHKHKLNEAHEERLFEKDLINYTPTILGDQHAQAITRPTVKFMQTTFAVADKDGNKTNVVMKGADMFKNLQSFVNTQRKEVIIKHSSTGEIGVPLDKYGRSFYQMNPAQRSKNEIDNAVKRLKECFSYYATGRTKTIDDIYKMTRGIAATQI